MLDLSDFLHVCSELSDQGDEGVTILEAEVENGAILSSTKTFLVERIHCQSDNSTTVKIKL
jgi:hypothetical protein